MVLSSLFLGVLPTHVNFVVHFYQPTAKEAFENLTWGKGNGIAVPHTIHREIHFAWDYGQFALSAKKAGERLRDFVSSVRRTNFANRQRFSLLLLYNFVNHNDCQKTQPEARMCQKNKPRSRNAGFTRLKFRSLELRFPWEWNECLDFVNIFLCRFSPSVFFYLATVCPSVWFLELDRVNKAVAALNNPNTTTTTTTTRASVVPGAYTNSTKPPNVRLSAHHTNSLCMVTDKIQHFKIPEAGRHIASLGAPQETDDDR